MKQESESKILSSPVLCRSNLNIQKGLIAKISKINLSHTHIKGKTAQLTVEPGSQFWMYCFIFPAQNRIQNILKLTARQLPVGQKCIPWKYHNQNTIKIFLYYQLFQN